MSEYMEIEQQFLQLVSIIENMQERIGNLEKSNQVLIKANSQLVEWVDDIVAEEAHFKENVAFELGDKRCEKELEEYWYPNIMSENDTLNYLLRNKMSIARFGDGEFATIWGRTRHNFQTMQDEKLAQRLKGVLNSEEENLMIAIADNYGCLDKYTQQARREIRHYMTRQTRREHLSILRKEKKYYNAYITRPYVMYADNQTEAPKHRFEQLKRIWNGRDCVFVEGAMTRLGVGNDLFDNASSVKRIIGPAENAFSKYDRILECCMTQTKETLFLLALGPTATVLAYDLCKAGYQAVDIGHIDLEYEWFLQGKGHRTEVPGKYNNEVQGGQCPETVNDSIYVEQIIADCSKE